MFGLIPFVSHNLDEVGGEFGDYLSDFFSSGFNMNRFNADVKETDNEYLLYAELPGVKKEDIKLDFKNNYLVIGAKREDEDNEKDASYIRKECSYGEFSRTFYFDDVQQDKISAKYEDGILKVILPKEVKKKDEGRKIKIQ